ncbi:glycosyltransferase [Poriferisphaera sp. WC338]|uniref:glycosyltransferase n=1 Tax=Poriferisphaera sp. WC338 TaxID=3425129 RepID=UPI003D813D62
MLSEQVVETAIKQAEGCRLLHIVREGGGLATPSGFVRLKGLLGAVAGVREHVLCVGGGWMRQACADAGIEGAELLGIGRGLSTQWRLRQELCRVGEVDAVHCDDLGMLWAADRALPNAKKLLWLRDLPNSKSWRRWLRRRAAKQDGLVMLTGSDISKARLVRMGLNASAIHVLQLGAPVDWLKREIDVTGWRKRWGVIESVNGTPHMNGHNNGQAVVVGLLCDRPWDVDVRTPALACGLADMVLNQKVGEGDLQSRLRVLIDPDVGHRQRAMHLANEFGHRGLLLQESACRRGWEIASACDVLFVIGRESWMSLMCGMLSGKPVIVEGWPEVRSLLGHGDEGVCVIDPNEKRGAADILTRWARDEQLRTQAGDLAAAKGVQLFGAENVRHSWAKAINGCMDQAT